jgi:hypothetical protein
LLGSHSRHTLTLVTQPPQELPLKQTNNSAAIAAPVLTAPMAPRTLPPTRARTRTPSQPGSWPHMLQPVGRQQRESQQTILQSPPCTHQHLHIREARKVHSAPLSVAGASRRQLMRHCTPHELRALASFAHTRFASTRSIRLNLNRVGMSTTAGTRSLNGSTANRHGKTASRVQQSSREIVARQSFTAMKSND